MSTKEWRLIVTPLRGNAPQHELRIEAGNWMSVLREARRALGEEGGLPPGASCAVAPDGTVTILDAIGRRKFELTPCIVSIPAVAVGEPAAATTHATAPAQAGAAQPRPTATATHPATEPAAEPAAEAAAAASTKKKKFQTVAYMPGMPVPVVAGAAAPAPAAAVATPEPRVDAVAPHAASSPRDGASSRPTAAASKPKAAVADASISDAQPAAPSRKKKFETVAFLPAEQIRDQAPVVIGQSPEARPRPASAPIAAASSTAPAPGVAAPAYKSGTSLTLDVLLSRDEAPSAQNPLTYRERAYVIPRGMSVMEAEAGLRFRLSDLQRAIEHAPRGKLVHLAAFDHHWTDQPQRPPLVVLEWRDWRGEPAVDYPAAERSTSSFPSGDDAETDDRLTAAFEALHELANMRTAAQGLELSVRLIESFVPAAAISACLYDINTDELRFVALTGPGASERQGSAVPRNRGLIGQAARSEHMALLVPNVLVQPSYDPDVDGRAGLLADNMLLRAIAQEGQLLGLLQLINREAGEFAAGDVQVVNYMADALATFLREVRHRARG